ncbi:TRAP transporter large permease [Sedimenticola thiotaurini]|uniref:TRAP transporter large permease protein n=1 Tax=Sedimenticola thiotaurini TaxID=1543721 RepID=A0A0F7K2Q0_9GAMM|nr:TRAP transporter large permease subunit [Sedimenticola thiotaurini]AKH21849.1 C4-dicarboxylate ABC transporter [Sedimenticola thiotaurini]
MPFNEILCILMFVSFIALLFTGFPVAWVLGGLAFIFTVIGWATGQFTDLMTDSFYSIDWAYTSAVVDRIWDVMKNWVLVALPMFIFMGLMLDRSGVAAQLMGNFVKLFGRMRGGYAVTVALIGILLAASTGIIGASVVLLSLLGLPVMLENKYRPSFAAGTVCSVGTLGILIPPSIMLVLMADRLAMSVGDLFLGALIPGVLLGSIYIIYMVVFAALVPGAAPAPRQSEPITWRLVLGVFWAVLPPAGLILAVLGSIFMGLATPTEASGVGAFGAIILAAINRKLNLQVFREVCQQTTRTTAFIFAIFLGATAFSLVLRGLGGDELIESALTSLPFGPTGIVITILVFTFLLGFFLDWIEITLIVLPLVGPVVQGLGFDLVWFTVLFAVCLQTSFLTPPVGFALFYLKGVAPKEVTVAHIYKGVLPFIALQLLGLVLVFVWEDLVTWLPRVAYGN